MCEDDGNPGETRAAKHATTNGKLRGEERTGEERRGDERRGEERRGEGGVRWRGGEREG